MPRKKSTVLVNAVTNIKSKFCDNQELSDRFVSDVLRVTGLEIDHEGYLVDAEDDGIEPEYVAIKNRPVRYSNAGILHNRDIIFDPYNNTMIMEELFKQYLAKFHPEVSSTQIYAAKNSTIPKNDTYGYISIIYGNGSMISTANHHKDTTKYLDAFMRLESMTDDLILDTLKPYDDYESSVL
jgi:hypothetical protein